MLKSSIASSPSPKEEEGLAGETNSSPGTDKVDTHSNCPFSTGPVC